MAGWAHGKAIVGNKVQYVSASSLQLADSSNGGCLRRYAYQYKFGIKEPPSDAMREGIEMHERLEHYLKTGDRSRLTQLELGAMHFIPKPNLEQPDLLVEHSIVPTNAQGIEDLTLAPLRSRGIPIVGKIDLLHGRGTNLGSEDINELVDPPNTIECLDWKRRSSMKYAPAGKKLGETIQMGGVYGRYVFAVSPTSEHVRLSHGNVPVKGAARKMTALFDREALAPAGQLIDAVTGSIIDAVAEKDINLVEANTRACRSYGKDCPAMFRADGSRLCTAPEEDTLAEYVGVTAADRFHLPVIQGNDMSAETPLPSIVSFIKNAGGASPNANVPALTAPVPPSPAAVASEVQRLTADLPVDPNVAILKELEDLKLGLPAFTGNAATAVAKARKQTAPLTGFAGTGELASFTITEAGDLPQLLVEVRGLASKRALAAAPPIPVVVPAIPIAAAAMSVAPAPTPIPPAASANEPAKRKPGRPAKVKETVPAPAPARVVVENCVMDDATLTVNNQAPEAVHVTVTQPVSTAINVFADCAVEGIATTSLWEAIGFVSAELNRNCGALDFRSVTDKNSPFAYAAWRGIFVAAFRKLNLAPGNYTLDNSSNELAQLALEAVRPLIRSSGGSFVRGTK